MTAKVAVVVVNWNGAADTIACLGSLAALATPPWRVYVVDNASADGSAARIAAARPEAVLVQAPQNRGFAAGCNLGAQRALAEGASHLWWLNNDTTVAADTLHALLAAAARLGPGIYSPKILCSGAEADPPAIWYAGGTLDWRLKSHHVGRGDPDDGRHDREATVAWASGCSLFCAAADARLVGRMDERYFLYLEDVEWCLRARRRGLPVYYVPAARVFHGVSRSVSRLAPASEHYYGWRNHYLLVQTHGRWWQRVYAGADLRWRLVKTALRLALFPAYRRDVRYRARTRGLRDAAVGRYGPQGEDQARPRLRPTSLERGHTGAHRPVA